MTTDDRIVNPECRQGKHRNCTGSAWNFAADIQAPCDCHCHWEQG